MSTCAMVIGLKSIAVSGSDATHENALKKRTMKAPFTFMRPSWWTHTYASPAPNPPVSAIAAANVPPPRKPGFITSAAPANARRRWPNCRHETRSPRRIHEKRTVKKGAVLFSVMPSPIGILDSA